MNMNRAFSTFQIKSVDDERREFSGIASTPTTDRMGDVVEPRGARFKLPIPLLSKHNKDNPIGHVTRATVTDKGIEYTAVIPKVVEEGLLKQRVDEAWQEVKYGIVRGVSIGFIPVSEQVEPTKTGYRFKEWDWFELSIVPIPANVEATISVVKSLATEERAASGDNAPGGPQASNPGESGKKQSATGGVLYARLKEQKMNVQEQIRSLEEKESELTNQRLAIQQKAVDEGRTKDAEEQEQFQALSSEIESVQKELKDMRELAKDVKVTPVAGRSDEEAKGARAPAVVSKAIKLKDEPGLMFARHAMLMYAAKNNTGVAAQLAKDAFGESCPVTKVLQGLNGRNLESVMKATVAAATTGDATWAGPLLAYNTYAGDFVEFMRPMTILGKFGTMGVPAAKRIPFNVHIKGQTSGGTAYWVGQGAPKPVTKFDFNDVYFGWFKVAAIAVATDEMIRFSDPAIEVLIRDGLAEAGAARMNTDFIDPTFAGSANVSPASILYGITPVASSGTDADAVRADLAALEDAAEDANNSLSSAVYIMNPRTAKNLGLMMNPLGQPEFGGVSRTGGSLNGTPVITSAYVPYDSSGGIVALVNADDLWYADDGQATVDMSNQASIQMLDNPTNNSATGTATSVVSMFQTDSTAFRMHRFANWKRRRDSSFAYLTGVNWGTGA